MGANKKNYTQNETDPLLLSPVIFAHQLLCWGKKKVQKLNNPLLLFPRGYTNKAARNRPTVIPIAI